MVTVLFLKQVKEKYKSLYKLNTLKRGNCLYEHTVCIKIRLHYIWKADESLRVTSGQVLKIRACYFLSNIALSVCFLWCCLSFEVKKYFSRVWKVLLIAILIRTGFEQKYLFWFSHLFYNAWEIAQWQNPGHLLSGLHISIMVFKTKQFCSLCISAVLLKKSLQLQEYELRWEKVYHSSAKIEKAVLWTAGSLYRFSVHSQLCH